MNMLEQFVYEEFHRKMEEPIIEAHIAEYEQSLKPMTVRMPPEELKTLDNIAAYFDISRQELNTRIIESGVTQILHTLAKASLHARKKIPEDIEGTPEYEAMLSEERIKIIKELSE